MEETTKKRGTLLTIWLIFILLSQIYSIENLIKNVGKEPTISYIYGLISLVNIICIYFLFIWKKWAFFAICGTTVIVVLIHGLTGSGIFAVFNFIGLIILYLIMRAQWNLFE